MYFVGVFEGLWRTTPQLHQTAGVPNLPVPQSRAGSAAPLRLSSRVRTRPQPAAPRGCEAPGTTGRRGKSMYVGRPTVATATIAKRSVWDRLVSNLRPRRRNLGAREGLVGRTRLCRS